MGYRTDYKIAEWVSYSLNSKKLRNCYARTDSFKPDPSLAKEYSAQNSDYLGSGYDRGHLIPAGDNKWSSTAMQESFLLSNMTPQTASFNRGIWKTLEDKVRAWASKSEELWVVTGPNLNSIKGYLGANKVAIPSAFYKVLVKKTGNKLEGVGILLNNSSSGNLLGYMTSIRSVEKATGINFFNNLSMTVQDQFESNASVGAFPIDATYQYQPCTSLNDLFMLNQ